MTAIDFIDLADRLNRARYKLAVVESAVKDDEMEDAGKTGLAFLIADIERELRDVSGIVHEPACDQQDKEGAT